MISDIFFENTISDRVSRSLKTGLVLLLLLITWELVVVLGVLPRLLFPPASVTFETLATLLVKGEIVKHATLSVFRALSGFLLSALVGIPLGLIIGWNEKVREYAGDAIEFLRPLSPIVLIPVTILALGLGNEQKIFLVWWGCIFPIFVNSMAGPPAIAAEKIEAAKTMDITGFNMFRKVILPGSTPYIFAGLRVSVAISMIAVIAAEMVSGGGGLGFYIINAQRKFKVENMYSGVILIAAIGFTLNLVIVKIENYVLRWRS